MAQRMDHWKRIPSDQILKGGDTVVSRMPHERGKRFTLSDTITAGPRDDRALLGGLGDFLSNGKKRKAINDMAIQEKKTKREKGISMRRIPVGLNVPIPASSLPRPGRSMRVREFIPSTTNTKLPAQFATLLVDNLTQTGIRCPTETALYKAVPRHRPMFIELLHPTAREPHEDTVVLRTISEVNRELYLHPTRFNNPERINREYRFLGYVDGIVAAAGFHSYVKDKSMINTHMGGEGAVKVDNIWFLNMEGKGEQSSRQRNGTVVFLVLVRRAYPSITTLHSSVLPSETRIPDPLPRDDDDPSSLPPPSSYPPEGRYFYWRYEPYASNNLSIWHDPPTSAYNGLGWSGSFVRLGALKDIIACQTGENGRFNNDIGRLLYPHEHERATVMRGEPPSLPQCTLVLHY